MFKHTKIQPKDDEWVCPKCGASDGYFCLENFDYIHGCPEAVGGETGECELLHTEETLQCQKCEYTTSGEKYAQHVGKMRKQNATTPCPHCAGTGMIQAPNGGAKKDDRCKPSAKSTRVDK